MRHLFISLRPEQWIKNLFVLAPLVFGGKLLSCPENLRAVAACVLFSLVSSTVYLINDILDYDQDKAHPVKRLRPIPAGKITRKQAAFLALLIGPVSVILSFVLNVQFGCVILVYFLFNFLYSKILKKIVLIDLFCIAVFFLLRIVAGTVVAEVVFSYWMILTVFLLAIFLGANKRRQDLVLLKDKAGESRSVLNEYNAYLIDQIISVVTSSIVVVYMLYTVDKRTVSIFGTSHLLYSIPFVYYGIFRYLYLVHKVHKYGDPTHIFLSDKMLQFNIAGWILTCVAVIYFHI